MMSRAAVQQAAAGERVRVEVASSFLCVWAGRELLGQPRRAARLRAGGCGESGTQTPKGCAWAMMGGCPGPALPAGTRNHGTVPAAGAPACAPKPPPPGQHSPATRPADIPVAQTRLPAAPGCHQMSGSGSTRCEAAAGSDLAALLR